MKILHVEDNRSDAELAHEVFVGEWPDCEVAVVDSRGDFLRALEGPPVSLIVSDFNLVNFNGLEALQLAREHAPEVPFVFLSGTIGEDRAIEALQAGAADYVIKDRPKRLVPALRRAVKDAALARERRVAAEQQLRLQRLENIGMLAAGIAHDLNNVLAPVLMGASLLKSRAQGESDQKILRSMETSALRGAGLVRQILGFAHGVGGEPEVIQPRSLIRELIGVMQQTFPKTVTVVDETDSALWPIRANTTQFHQVLLNLGVNARDAMPKGGTLTVRARNRQLMEAAPDGLAAGSYLVLEVIDTGTGIPPDVLARIWEPFFTTKTATQGTGLGLATVRGLVQDHGGAITVETKVGRGTTFRVFWPAIPGRETEAGQAQSAEIPRGNGEWILVVDDDASVRELTCAALTAHGYHVQTASDGTEAMARFAVRSLEFRVLVTDLDLPHLDGVALAKVVRELNPKVRVVLMSGSAVVDDPRRRAPPSGRFLAKPFEQVTLLQSLHELLHAPA